MNEHEKAIEELKSRAGRTLKTPLSEETVELAVGALGRQIPQKPYKEIINKTIFRYVCPNCFLQLIEEQKCCDSCGKRLEW